MNGTDNPLAMAMGAASAAEPPAPAQQHLDQARHPLGDGGGFSSEAHADDYEEWAVAQDVTGTANGGAPVASEDPENVNPGDGGQGDATGGEFDVADHTADEVLAWVGDDADKAQVALDGENAQADPRPDLVEMLEEIAGIENEDDEVPDGTIDEVTEWVGDDKERAQQALDAEQAKDKPRSTLIEDLQRIIAE